MEIIKEKDRQEHGVTSFSGISVPFTPDNVPALVVIRKYKYEDPNTGWGDIGTLGYVEVLTKKCKMLELSRFDGSKYYRLILPEVPELKYVMGVGMQLSSRDGWAAEVEYAKAQLADLQKMYKKV